MSSIKYKGTLYVEAAKTTSEPPVRKVRPSVPSKGPAKKTDHERCEKGTHWNELKKKCMKLPASLNRMRTHALIKSRTADSASNAADFPPPSVRGYDHEDLHHTAADLHHDAMNAHQKFADKAQKHGFKELAMTHRDLVEDHKESKNDHNAFQAEDDDEG
jgi:hypothetical protein